MVKEISKLIGNKWEEKPIYKEEVKLAHPYAVWKGVIDNWVIDKINGIKVSKEDLIDPSKTAGENVLFQTRNVVHKFDESFFEFMYHNVLPRFWGSFKRYYNVDDLYIDYIHLIKYSKGGRQKPHSHFFREDWSFIIYLEDDEKGGTVFYTDEGEKIGESIKGNILIWPSNIIHSSLPSINKRVVVGSIIEKNKVWLKREEDE